MLLFLEHRVQLCAREIVRGAGSDTDTHPGRSDSMQESTSDCFAPSATRLDGRFWALLLQIKVGSLSSIVVLVEVKSRGGIKGNSSHVVYSACLSSVGLCVVRVVLCSRSVCRIVSVVLMNDLIPFGGRMSSGRS